MSDPKKIVNAPPTQPHRFRRPVDGGRFELDADELTVTDSEGRTIHMPANAAGDLQQAIVDGMHDVKKEPSWFDESEVSEFLEKKAGRSDDRRPQPADTVQRKEE